MTVGALVGVVSGVGSLATSATRSQVSVLGSSIRGVEGKVDIASGKLDAVNGKLDVANEKLDAVAAEVRATRSDLGAKLDQQTGVLVAIRDRL